MGYLTNQKSKSLGIKLFGNVVCLNESNTLLIDPDLTYEIFLNPEESPAGTLIHSRKQEEKKIVVELPSEIQSSNYEKICSFLLEHNHSLIVKEWGYEKLGNKKLIVEIGPGKELLVNIVISIQGSFDSRDYAIEINPYDLNSSWGELRNEKNKQYFSVDLHLGELKQINSSLIKNVLPKLKPNNFNIRIKRDQLYLDLGEPLSQFISSLGKPSKYQNIRINQNEVSYHFLPNEVDFSSSNPISVPEGPKTNVSSNYQRLGLTKTGKSFSRFNFWQIFSKK